MTEAESYWAYLLSHHMQRIRERNVDGEEDEAIRLRWMGWRGAKGGKWCKAEGGALRIALPRHFRFDNRA